MSREKEKELDELIEKVRVQLFDFFLKVSIRKITPSKKLEAEVADLDQRLRHEREKLADIELFIAGGALDPMKPATFSWGLIFFLVFWKILEIFKFFKISKDF